MSADVMVQGTLKTAPHITYTETRQGITYSFYSGGKQVSVQLIRTQGKVEYRNPTNLPLVASQQLRTDLGRISKHFSGTKK